MASVLGMDNNYLVFCQTWLTEPPSHLGTWNYIILEFWVAIAPFILAPAE